MYFMSVNNMNKNWDKNAYLGASIHFYFIFFFLLECLHGL